MSRFVNEFWMTNSPRPIFLRAWPVLLKFAWRTAVNAWKEVRHLPAGMKISGTYFSGANEFQMKWAVSSKHINEIDRLLALHLSRYVSDEILDIQNDLKYLDARLSTILLAFCARIIDVEDEEDYVHTKFWNLLI
jgi:hypothetical protein